jgi:hypothetical protein
MDERINQLGIVGAILISEAPFGRAHGFVERAAQGTPIEGGLDRLTEQLAQHLAQGI